MKRRVLLLGAVFMVLAAFAGSAVAAELSGTVTQADARKGVLKIVNEKIEVGFDCETGSLIRDIKAGDHVTVEYTEENGKKKATRVSPLMIKKTAPTGC